jgi:hypothetical protein
MHSYKSNVGMVLQCYLALFKGNIGGFNAPMSAVLIQLLGTSFIPALRVALLGHHIHLLEIMMQGLLPQLLSPCRSAVHWLEDVYTYDRQYQEAVQHECCLCIGIRNMPQPFSI